jgi:flagellar biosynthesis/type III secretory pathway M-ring protein FliF/YscJ
MLDQAVAAAQVDQITQVVTAAAGIQQQRGDQVSVVSLPFDDSLSARLKDQQKQDKVMEYVQAGSRVVGILVAFAGIFILFRYLTGTTRAKTPPALAAAEPNLLPGGTAALLPPGVADAQIAQGTGSLGLFGTSANDRLGGRIGSGFAAGTQGWLGAGMGGTEADNVRRQRVRESVVQLAMQKPDVLADVLSTWLEQGRSQGANGGA